MAVDNAPVTAAELEKAHNLIRSQVTTRWSSFRKAFRARAGPRLRSWLCRSCVLVYA